MYLSEKEQVALTQPNWGVRPGLQSKWELPHKVWAALTRGSFHTVILSSDPMYQFQI